MPSIRRAIRTAFGAIGLIFFFGAPIIAFTQGWGLLMAVVLAAIGVVALAIAVLMFSEHNQGA